MSTIIVSRCLTGDRCLYHGGRATFALAYLAALAREHEIVAVCPEMLGGLPCPRPPARWHNGRIIGAGVQNAHAYFQAGRDAALRLIEGREIGAALLLSGSPSCDPLRGLFGVALAQRGIPCVSCRRDNGWERAATSLLGRPSQTALGQLALL